MKTIIGIALVALVMLIFVVAKQKSRGRISKASQAKFAKEWKNIESQSDPQLQIIQADKLVDHVLGELGYTGSFADKMKAAGPRFSNTNDIWAAHKLRNRIAHETGFSVDTKQAERAMLSYKKLIEQFVDLRS